MTKAKDAKPPRPKRAGPTGHWLPDPGIVEGWKGGRRWPFARSYPYANQSHHRRVPDLRRALGGAGCHLIPQHVNTHRFGGGRPRVPDTSALRDDSGPHLLLSLAEHLLRAAHWLPVEGAGRHGHLLRVHRPPALSGMGCRWGVPGRSLWRVGLERYDELKGLDWSWLSMDGAMTKSPLGGGKKPGPNPTDRGKAPGVGTVRGQA